MHEENATGLSIEGMDSGIPHVLGLRGSCQYTFKHNNNNYDTYSGY